MSIKTFRAPEGDKLLFFLILSILIHMVAVWALTSAGGLGYFARTKSASREPITVDVVRLPEERPAVGVPKTIVKLPPIETQKLSKEKKPATHIAQRAQSVEKETYPAPSPGSTIGRSGGAPGAAPPVKTPEKKATAGGVKGTGEKGGTKAGAPSAPALEGEDTYAAGAPGAGTGLAGREKKAGETIITPPRPNLFLTEDRISELIRKYESEPQKGEKGKILQLNTSESKYAEYVTEALVPPIEFRMGRGLAARRGWLGNLLIDFTVKADGSLGEIVLVRSSGNPALDDDAVTALKLAAPFAPIPAKFEMEEITIRGIFIYY